MRINRLSFLAAAALMGAAQSFRMVDDTPAVSTPVAAPVTVEVPAEHADLIQRAIALLKKGEQFVTDNIHAGLTALEGLFEGKPTELQPAELEPTDEDAPNA